MVSLLLENGCKAEQKPGIMRRESQSLFKVGFGEIEAAHRSVTLGDSSRRRGIGRPVALNDPESFERQTDVPEDELTAGCRDIRAPLPELRRRIGDRPHLDLVLVGDASRERRRGEQD
jgi:hypothetical protein